MPALRRRDVDEPRQEPQGAAGTTRERRSITTYTGTEIPGFKGARVRILAVLCGALRPDVNVDASDYYVRDDHQLVRLGGVTKDDRVDVAHVKSDGTTSLLKTLEKLRLPELQAKYAELVGEKTRSPNRKHLLRRITEALAAREQDAIAQTAIAPSAESTTAKVKLTKLSVAELQAMHREILGRDTTSSDSAYLVWRLRQAQKGRIKVGPIERRASADADIKVLPLRMTVAEVEQLDAGWKRLGFKSRTAMIRKAIEAMLA